MLVSAMGVASPATATPIMVGFTTGDVDGLAFAQDTFSMHGMPGVLTLDTELETTHAVSTADLIVGNSGSFVGTQTVTFSYDLTLNGITHTLTQTGTWFISPEFDSFAMDASDTVLFKTPAGRWAVTLNAFSFPSVGVGSFAQPATADFAPVPEPASIFLLGGGAIGLVMRRRRRTVA